MSISLVEEKKGAGGTVLYYPLGGGGRFIDWPLTDIIGPQEGQKGKLRKEVKNRESQKFLGGSLEKESGFGFLESDLTAMSHFAELSARRGRRCMRKS